MTGTYVYCLVANRTKPRSRPALKRMPHARPVRLVAAGATLWLVVADVPLAHYGETALKKALGNLDWVAQAAVAHETVVESFLSADAVLPMKLFTIFADDERARRFVVERGAQVDGLIARVARKDEWGIRVALGSTTGTAPRKTTAKRNTPANGSSYLLQKKAQRDALATRATRARAVAANLFDALASHAAEARRRPATELPEGGGPLVLDAAFLVPRSAASKLKAAAARQMRALTPEGYHISLTGPWPPYSFMQD